MGQINTQEELRRAIADLEKKKSMQEMVMKGQFEQVKTEMKPVNLVRNTFSRFAAIPEVRKTLIDTIVGFGIGYIANKATKVMSEESLDNIVGNLVNKQVSRMEQNDPESFFSKSLSYVRKNIKRESPLYPFLGYKSDY
jgi:L-alanine-DL-glutamate epimerase-like enolase superfamily enzyme